MINPNTLNGLEDITESIAGEKIVVGVTGRERASVPNSIRPYNTGPYQAINTYSYGIDFINMYDL
jgi:hypothetical protein